jgi:HAD superfamily hydrolase (TIGR01509 family)
MAAYAARSKAERKINMAIKGAIFDVDGTLLDSMAAWSTVGSDYMRSLGMEPPADLDEAILRLSVAEAAEYVKALGVPGSAEKIRVDMNGFVDDFYLNRVSPRPGVPEMLAAFRENGVKMCVATASDRGQIETGLRHAGILRYIDRIFTCTELNTTKHYPVIFHAAREYMGTAMDATWVFEDARHSAQTAKAAGYRVCGIFDPSEPDQAGLRAASDLYLTTFEGAQHALLSER